MTILIGMLIDLVVDVYYLWTHKAFLFGRLQRDRTKHVLLVTEYAVQFGK